MVRRSILLATFAVVVACGSAPEPTPAAPGATHPRLPRPPAAADAPEPVRRGGGSSDGVTCEEARDAHPDEVGIGAKKSDGPEPSDDQFSGPLAKGSYLNDCEVPESTKVSVCAAIVDGKAAGVTVATDPSDPDKEKCVSGKI